MSKPDLPKPDLPALARFAEHLADQSGAIIREAIAQRRSFDTKSDRSPVTEIDRRVEASLRRALEAAHPDHGILGEEYASVGLERDFVWVLDPIDGTKAFITGIPTFGTLIALAYRGVPILGVIDNPVTRERWVGVDGTPTRRNGEAVTSRKGTALGDATLGNGNPEPFDARERAAFERLRVDTRWCVYGGGCHAYGRVADGALDISIDSGLDAFDYCALAPIVRNAGGAISDWEGKPLTIHSGHRCVASGSPELHEKVLERLRLQ